ncbi:hypothetical protein [Pseudomonas aeruginosa]|nr:hypothetical protein [Pseudomonas aeruginosa]
MDIENQRDEADEGQKLVAVGSREDLAVSMRFIEDRLRAAAPVAAL